MALNDIVVHLLLDILIRFIIIIHVENISQFQFLLFIKNKTETKETLT